MVRPTSETIIGEMFSRWIQSYRDLPLKINQWANVVRWEMRTRLFLRTAEFLWQEGHTAHATDDEAWEETKMMLDVYAEFAETQMAMPVIKGEKTAAERFPGAESTLTIEAMMQDRKALQAGTSHFLGQNFSRAQEIKFQSQQSTEEYAWTTSWGLSTRMVGALIMTHADDDGMIVPPKLAPKHVAILPIYRNDDERSSVLEYSESLRKEVAEQEFDGRPVEVFIDDRDIRGGEKKWYHVKRGVPIRAEIGPRDIAANKVLCARRDQSSGQGVDRAEFVSTLPSELESIQSELYERALAIRSEHTREIDSLDEFREFFTPQRQDKPEIHGGFAICSFNDVPELEPILKELKVTARCIPLADGQQNGTCIFTGQPSEQKGVFAKAY